MDETTVSFLLIYDMFSRRVIKLINNAIFTVWNAFASLCEEIFHIPCFDSIASKKKFREVYFLSDSVANDCHLLFI